MAFTREQWCYDLLAGIGNIKPNLSTVDFVCGWTTAETNANSGARFNLLNTTQPALDSTDFNSVHVKNYSSYREGIRETVITLQNGYYPYLLKALQTNDMNALAGPSADVLAELNTWCGHCNYGHGFMVLGSQHLNDQFIYGNAPGGEQTPMLKNYSTQSADFDHYFTAIDADHWQCKKSGNVIQFGLKNFFETLSIDGDSLPMPGLPTSNEIYADYQGHQIVVQFCERAVLIYDEHHFFDSQPGAQAVYLAHFDNQFIVSLDPNRRKG
jgi:hypothetical protein